MRQALLVKTLADLAGILIFTCITGQGPIFAAKKQPF